MKRCQGSCPLTALSCLPASVKQVTIYHIVESFNFHIFPKVSVPALLAPATLSIGQAQPVCHIAQVMMMMVIN